MYIGLFFPSLDLDISNCDGGDSTLGIVIHVWQSIKFRMWWALPTLVVSGTLEILGWSSRLWLSKSPLALTPYEIQLVGTILGPTPLVAATFVILGKIINTLGSQYSRLSSKLYTILFLSVDCVCLIIQGVGGAIAANAVSQGMDPGRGGNIMLGGIVTQMVCILFFVGCGVEFFVRVHSRTPVRILAAPTTLKRGGLSLRDINMKTMIATLGFMTMCFLVRSISVCDGYLLALILLTIFIDVCDGGMIVLAMYALNIAHPGFLLRKRLRYTSTYTTIVIEVVS
ncbi:RTA1 like protein-domain-containing protein [Scleroderma yunnanense]